MRILFLTPFAPDPEAPHGGGSYLGSLAAALAHRAELGLVHLEAAHEPASAAIAWQWRAAAEFEGDPARGGAHRLRMLWRWRSRPLLAAKYWNPRLVPLLERARREFAPDVVLAELALMAQYLPYVGGAPSILTDHEAGIPGNAATGLGRLADRRDRRLWRRYLREHCARATLLQALTAEDAHTLGELLGREVLVRPPCVPVPERPVDPGRAPPRALFLGDYGHRPNPEAAERLVRDVLPRMREALPATELWLAGARAERIAHLAGAPGVRIRGFVPDLHALFGEVRVLLAPLWSGAGFRVKVATALAHGLPTVSNALGARGCAAPAAALRVAESPAELADAALGFLRAADAARAAGHSAHAWARTTLAPDAVARLQLERAQALIGARAR